MVFTAARVVVAASWSGQHDPIDGKSGGIVPRSMQALLDRKSWFTELDMYTSCLVVRALLVELFLAVICSSTAPCTVRGVEVAALTLVATWKIVSLFTPRWWSSCVGPTEIWAPVSKMPLALLSLPGLCLLWYRVGGGTESCA